MKKLILAIAIFLGASPLWAELMTYQGRLKESDVPVTGNRLFTFEFCDAEDGSGLCLIAPGTPANFAVANGLFKSTVTIHPGVDLAAGAWYLRVTVGSSVLTPLERLTAVPYSVFASSAGYAAYAAGAVQKAGDTMTGQLTLAGSTLTVTGSEFSVGGSTFVVKDGSVGIGTASPNNPLEVWTNGQYVFTGGAPTSNAVVNLIPQVGGTAMINNNADGPVALAVGHVPHLLVDKAGNVGISSTTPSYRLVVSSGAGEAGTIMAVSTGTSNLFWVAGDGAHATKFYGDGSGLSGVTGATDNTKVLKAGDTMTGPLAVMVDPAVNSFDIQTNGITISTSGAITTFGLGLGSASPGARGQGAADLQTKRTAIDQIASGQFSSISGGALNTAAGEYSVVSGGYKNTAAGQVSIVSGGQFNTVSGINSSVSGGQFNVVTASNSAVSGGAYNTVAGTSAVIAGGENNAASGKYSSVMGGQSNTASGNYAFIGGGDRHTASGPYTVIGGGDLNRALGQNAAILGGIANVASGNYSSMGAGLYNYASGYASVVPGGDHNVAGGNYSFAAGYHSSSTVQGAFTWSDSEGLDNINSVTDRTVFKSRGGFLVTGSTNTSITGTLDRAVFITGNGLVGISTGAPQAALDVVSTGTASDVYAQIWRDSTGLVVGSVSAAGFMKAVKFVGDGSGLTGVTGASGTDTSKVLKAGDTMTGDLTMALGSTITVTGSSFSVGGATLAVRNGFVGIGTASPAAPLTVVNSGGSSLMTVGATGVAVDTVTANGTITAARYYISGSPALAFSGLGNLLAGKSAGALTTSGDANTMAGAYAGGSNTTGGSNAMVGAYSGYSNISGSYNALLGKDAGYGSSGFSFSKAAMVGYQAGYALMQGDSNVFLGHRAGYSVTVGSANIVIGADITTPETDSDYTLNIGGVLHGDLAARTIGISTRAPQAALDIVSTGTLHTQMAQVWRDSTGLIVGSMSVTGSMQAAKFVGNGAGLTGVTALDGTKLALTGGTMGGVLNMNGNFLSGVSTITMLNGSIAIVPPGTGGNNYGYGISIGSDSFNNYTSGVGLGKGASDNYSNGVGIGNGAAYNSQGGVGVGFSAQNNGNNGVGIGYSAYGNFQYGVGVGNNASANNNHGVGVGDNASGNDNYAVGIGAYSQNNQPYGAALGAYSYAASSSVALGYMAKANAWNSVAIGSGTVNNSTGTASFGNYAVNAPAYWINGSTVIRQGPGIATLAIGSVAGMADGGAYNLFVGSAAGHAHTSGANNVMLGYGAGYQNTNGAGNTFIGAAAGNTNSDGDLNIIIGYDQHTSGPLASSELNIGGLIFGKLGEKSVGISTRTPQAALDVVSTGTLSTQFAQIWRNSAGAIVASMTANGQFATLQPLPGDNLGTHVAAATLQMGPYAINSSSAVSAAYYQVNGSTVLALRSGSLAVGPGAGRQNAGLENVFVGTQAGENTVAGDYNVFLGYQSGMSNTAGYHNAFLGTRAGRSNVSGTDNTMVGVLAGSLNQTGSANTALGYSAGYGLASNSFSSATLVGYNAGAGLSTGSDNIFVGFKAGDSVTTGGRNIIIGYDQDASAPAASSELNIGGVLFGDLSAGEVYVGSGAAVSTITPFGFFGDGSGLTNITAAGAVQKTGDVMDGPLYIDGTGGANVSLKITRIASGDLITAGLSAGATAVIYADGSSVGLFSTDALDRVDIGAGMTAAMSLTQNRAGVNNTSPYYTLDVNGPGRFADQIIAGGSVTVAGNAFSVGASTFVVTAGRVGINWITPEAALQVSGGAKFLSSAGTSYILTAGSAARPDMFFVSSGGAVGMGDFTGVSVDTASAVQISSRLTGATNGTEDVRVGLFVESNTDGTLDSADLLVSGNFEATVRGGDAPSLVSPLRLKVRRENAPTGTVDRAIGLFIDDLQNEAGGTINNTYGIFIGDQSSGSQNNDPYALFSVDPNARSYFAGSVGIARTIPEARLDLAAAGIGPTFMGQIWRGFDGTIVSSMSATGIMMATKFVGDGSGLTGLSGVQKTGDTMTGPLTMSGSSITIRNSFGNEGLEIRDPAGAVIPELRLARDGGSYWDIGGAGGGTPLVFQYGGVNRMFLASEGHLTLNDSGQVVSRLHLRPAVTDLYSLYISSADSITPAFTVKPGGELYAAGRVGIGSAAPTEALDISNRVLISTRAGGNEVTDGLISNGTGGMEYYSGGTKYMKVANGGGYIGIGPSANVYSNTMSPKLQVKGSMSVGSGYNSFQPPAESLVVQGRLGAGTSAPDAALSVVQSDVAASSYTVHIGTSASAYHLVVTTGGWVGINTRQPQAPLHLTAATKDEGIVVEHNSNTSEGSYLALLKARGTAYSQTLVQDGDNLGVLAYGGYNNTAGDPFPTAAAIVGRVDGTPTVSAPDMPGRLEFMTAADGTNETVTRMVIKNDGAVGISTGIPQAMLDIRSTGTLAQIWRDAGGVARATMTASGVLYAVVGSAVQKIGDTMSGNLSINVDTALYAADFNTTGIRISTAGSITTLGLGNGVATPNQRGLGAVDLQTARAISGQIAQGAFSTLSGGAYNTILGSNTVVAGGRYNIAAGTSAVISGGEGNYAGSLFSTIGGGKGNSANGTHSAVFSGEGNFADEMFALVGGGAANTANTSYSVVAGGSGNEAGVSGGDGQGSFIGGGQGNNIRQNYGAIAGGMNNLVGDFADYGFVGGGYENDANGTHSAVAGGWWNVANSMDSFIGGGSYNTVDGATGVIAGGYQNKMQSGADSAFIGGGKNNTVTSSGLYSAVVGGSSNTVSGEGSFIGGGAPQSAGNPGNKVYANFASIVGGSSNTITSAAYWGFIGGGINNQVSNESSVVVGGDTNLASGIDAVVVGGLGNKAAADSTFVGGGASNIASGTYAIVPGGRENTAMGAYSFAAGYKSSSTLNGTFTWSDSVGLQVLNSVANQVMFKAAGGFWVSTGTVYADPGLYVSAANKVGIGTSAPGFKLHVKDTFGGAIAGLTNSVSGTDAAVYGWANNGATAVKGVAASGYAGRFEGNVFVTDDGVNPANPAKLQVKGDLGLGNGLQDGNTPIVIWLTASTPFVDGDVVIVSGNYQFGTTTTGSSSAVIGVAQGSGAASSTGKIAVDGVVIANCLNGTAGQHAVTSTTAGQVQGQGFPTSGTSVGIFLTNCGNPVVNRAVLLLK